MLKISSYTGGFFQTNGYLIEGPEGAVLFDAPEGIASWLESREIRISHLFLTHLHYDHVIDVAALKESQGCLVRAFAQPNDDLTLLSVLKEMIGWPANIEPFEVAETLEGETETEAAGMKFELRHVPGHSPDSLVYLPTEPVEDEPAMIGGDTLFRGGVGRTDFPHGDHALFFEGIREKLLTLPGETRVYPGHGPATTIAHELASNPFLMEF